MSTETVIFIGVAFYMLAMLIIGAYSSKKSNSVDEFVVAGRGMPIWRCSRTVRATWWGGAADRQRFLYVPLLPPHQPYDPPEPYLERFAPGTERELGLTNVLVELNESGPGALDEKLLAQIRARYDAGVAYADSQCAERRK